MPVNTRTRKLAVIAMLSAMAFIVTYVFSLLNIFIFASAPFLTIDPKDVIIVTAGFLFGPLASFLSSVTVSFIEMLTVSRTGFYGLVMNVFSTCAFACPAALIYKYKKNFTGAVWGLTAGCFCMAAGMMLWNYLITPLYMGVPRAVVADMLFPVFLPFNLIKGGINVALTMLLYKPLVTVLRKAGLVEESGERIKNSKTMSTVNILVSAVIIIAGVLLVLAFRELI